MIRLISVWLIFFVVSGTPVFPLSPLPQEDVFMWVGFRQLLSQDPENLENILLFAKRLEIIPYASGMNDPEVLEEFLKICRSLDIPRTWIEISPGRSVSLRGFVDGPSFRADILERFQRLARVYRHYYPEFARITIFDEAPLGAFGSSSGEGSQSYLREVEDFRCWGPQAYAWLHLELKKIFPEAEVGIFLHHPHNASPQMSGRFSLIQEFMHRCQDLKALPDFIFSDVYRGYFNRGYGREQTNAYIRDVVAHTREVAEKYGARCYYLGQMHTIKLGYTPSRLDIDSNIQTVIRSGAHGMGWYWPNYAATNHLRAQRKQIPGKPEEYDVSFRPFVPNSWGRIGPAGSVYGTSKDRFVYSYLKLLEETEQLSPEERFDLWLYGYDIDHVEHKIFLKDFSGSLPEWEFIGSINPQQDDPGYHPGVSTDFSYSGNEKWKAVCFHALSRRSFLLPISHGDYRMELKIISSKGDDSKLAACFALPYPSADHYITEKDMTGLIQNHPRWLKVESLCQAVFSQPKNLSSGQELCVDMVPDNAVFRGDFWSLQALKDILPFWTEYGQDPWGGFFSSLSQNWKKDPQAEKYPGMISRHIFSYSCAFLLTGEERFLDQASRLTHYLIKKGWDPRHGGWYTSLDRNGRPVDTTKDGFYQIYAAAGLAMYHFITHDKTALDYTLKTLTLWNLHAWDKEKQGYFRRFSRDWEPINTEKTCSNQLAPVSGPLIYLYLATRDRRWRDQMERILDVVFTRMQDSETGWIQERFDSLWNPLPRKEDSPRINVGHNQEAAWMAVRLYRLTGKEVYRLRAEQLWERLSEWAWNQKTGAWYHKIGLLHPEVHDQGVSWWIQAYGNLLSLYIYPLNHDAKALEIFTKGSLFWNRFFLDSQSGACFLSVNQEGTLRKGDKAVRTKTSYHSLEHSLLNYLYLSLWFNHKPVNLYFAVDNPKGQKLYPLPVENSGVKITTVLINGSPWPHYGSDRPWIQLPTTGPSRIQVTLEPTDLNSWNARFLFPPPRGVKGTFDLWILGDHLDRGAHCVFLNPNPGQKTDWLEVGRWDEKKTSDSLRVSPSGVIISDLSLRKFFGGDIRENAVEFKITSSEEADLAKIQALIAMPSLYFLPDKAFQIKDYFLQNRNLVHSLQIAGLYRPSPRELKPDSFYVEHLTAPVRFRQPGIMESLWLDIVYKNR